MARHSLRLFNLIFLRYEQFNVQSISLLLYEQSVKEPSHSASIRLEFVFRFRNGFRCIFRFCPCISWSPEFASHTYNSCRSFSEPAALGVVYTSQRKKRTISIAHAPPTSMSEISINLQRHHRQIS